MEKMDIEKIKKLYSIFRREITSFGYSLKVIENELFLVGTTSDEEYQAHYSKSRDGKYFTISAIINELPLNIVLCSECISIYYGGVNASTSLKKLMTYKKSDYDFEITETFKKNKCVFSLSQYGKELTIQAKVTDKNNNKFSWIFRVYKSSKNIFYETSKGDSLGIEQIKSGIETYYMILSKKDKLKSEQNKSGLETDYLAPTNFFNVDKYIEIIATGKKSSIINTSQDFPNTSFNEALQALTGSPSISSFINTTICVLNAEFPGLEETIKILVTDLYPVSNKNEDMCNYVTEALKTIALEDMIDLEELLPQSMKSFKS